VLNFKEINTLFMPRQDFGNKKVIVFNNECEVVENPDRVIIDFLN